MLVSKHARRPGMPVLAGVAAVALTATVQAGTLTLAEWIGPALDNWHVNGNWDPTGAPNGAGFHAIVNNGGGSTAVVNSNTTLGKLTIGPSNVVEIDNGRVLFISNAGGRSGVIDNAGVLEIGSTGSSTYLRPTGAVTLMGGGVLQLSDHSNNWMYHNGGGSLTNMDNTIQGSGRFGWTSASTAITNHGTIIANQTNELRCTSGTLLFTNTGTLRADNGATLHLEGSGGFDNIGGVIEALDASNVTAQSTTISGGTLQTAGSGVINFINNAAVDGSVDQIDNFGLMRSVNGHHLFAVGTINNTGTLMIDSTGSSTYLRPNAGVLTLTGGGTVQMTDGSNNWIYQADGGSLVNVDNTIQGAGNVGWASAATAILNQGTIIANGVNELSCNPGSELFTNEGTLRAQDGATLRLGGTGGFDNALGVIEALDGSAVAIQSTTIRGGDLLTDGSGFIGTQNGSLLDASVDTIDNTGDLRLLNGHHTHAVGTINNTGTITIDSTGSSTYLHPDTGVLTLTGGGTVQLSNQSVNWIFQANDGSLVNVDNTIRGAGNVGWTSASTAIDNQGVIIADQSAGLKCTSGSLEFVNTGTMRAQDGANMEITGTGGIDNTGGLIEALDGSTVTFDNTTLRGGTLQTSGSGLIRTRSNTLLDGTVRTIHNTGELEVINGHHMYAKGTLNNTGTITIAGTGSSTYLHPEDSVLTLTGGGTVVMPEFTNVWIYQTGGGSLLNVDNTIRGAGRLGWASAATSITNQGAVIADSDTADLDVHAGSQTFDNQGSMSAEGDAGMTIGGGFTTSGDVTIASNSEITRTGNYPQTAGSTTVEGTLDINSGSFQLMGGSLSGGGNVESNVNNTGGDVGPGSSAGLLSIVGNYTQSTGGELHIELAGTGDPGVDYDQLAISGNAMLGGYLRLSAIDGYTPSVGDTFTVLTAASVMGRFEAVIPCGTYQVTYTDTSVEVEVLGGPPVEGDVSCDGDADLQDLGFLCLQLGLTDSDPDFNPQADLNGDGVIDYDDRAQLEAIAPPCMGDIVASATFQPPADLTVDGADLAYLLGQWGAGLSCADIVTSATFEPPPDGVVDGADLAVLLGAWGACR